HGAIDKALDWVVAKVKALWKKAKGALSGKGKGKGAGAADGEDGAEGGEGKGKDGNGNDGAELNVEFQTTDGEQHRLWMKGEGQAARMMVASADPDLVIKHIADGGAFQWVEGDDERQVKTWVEKAQAHYRTANDAKDDKAKEKALADARSCMEKVREILKRKPGVGDMDLEVQRREFEHKLGLFVLKRGEPAVFTTIESACRMAADWVTASVEATGKKAEEVWAKLGTDMVRKGYLGRFSSKGDVVQAMMKYPEGVRAESAELRKLWAGPAALPEMCAHLDTFGAEFMSKQDQKEFDAACERLKDKVDREILDQAKKAAGAQNTSLVKVYEPGKGQELGGLKAHQDAKTGSLTDLNSRDALAAAVMDRASPVPWESLLKVARSSFGQSAFRSKLKARFEIESVDGIGRIPLDSRGELVECFDKFQLAAAIEGSGGRGPGFDTLLESLGLKTREPSKDVLGPDKTMSSRKTGQSGMLPEDYSSNSNDAYGVGPQDENAALGFAAGCKANLVNEEHEFIADMREKSIPVSAGISGTAQRIMNTVKYLNAKPLVNARLACIGYLVPPRHHSFHEVMAMASQFSGCGDYQDGDYTNVKPLQRPTLVKLAGTISIFTKDGQEITGADEKLDYLSGKKKAKKD
ncbi:MAG: hypothetical protein FJ087_16475, partial [Deltaproteobacteria bacterium]|nr:hypothetical protein [Deltaproteobacteria bacterium]